MLSFDRLQILEWGFLAYYAVLQLTYLALTLLALPSVVRHIARESLDDLPPRYSEHELPVSIIVPCWNEQATVVGSVRALLELRYGSYEVIVVNDGSTDASFEVLTNAFDLRIQAVFGARVLPTAEIRGEYLSARYGNLRVIDKVNGGGKADALNAGINAARYPLVCCVDSDSILDPDALRIAARPFMERPETVAVGGTIRVANGCRVDGGRLSAVHLPRRRLARYQALEYVRAFLSGRIGWSSLNAVLIVSGAFGVFRRDAVLAAGGYRPDAAGEDMELVTRLHRQLRQHGEPYRVAFVPNPVCWTEVPEDLRSLGRQRIRWHRGLAEALWLNRDLLFDRQSGVAGWLAFPFFVLFECLAPIIELAGVAFLTLAVGLGRLSASAYVAYLLLVLAGNLLLSAGALLLEELSDQVYPRRRDLLRLIAAAVGENFGYRQLNTVWRIVGLWQWAFARSASWKPIRRSGSWQHAVHRPA